VVDHRTRQSTQRHPILAREIAANDRLLGIVSHNTMAAEFGAAFHFHETAAPFQITVFVDTGILGWMSARAKIWRSESFAALSGGQQTRQLPQWHSF
jgi:hypothetical protein